jgi:PHD/YefM family antitoxin component YafN of YafNO toxin-antitoxin module
LLLLDRHCGGYCLAPFSETLFRGRRGKVRLTGRHKRDNYIRMKNTYNVARAQANFTRLLKQAEQQPIAITRHDETVAYILSANRMEAIIETLEVMGNLDAMKAIREHQAGKTKFVPLSALDDN